MDQRLAGKVAIVTGASKGVGAAVARMYGAEGAKVVLNYHSSEDEAWNRVLDVNVKGTYLCCMEVALL